MTEETATRPCIMVVSQPRRIVRALESECLNRRWIPVCIDDLDEAITAVEHAAVSAIVVPLHIAEVADGRFCAYVRELYPDRFLPIVAYAAGAGWARAMAWAAGCDAFVPHGVGAPGLCREIAVLLAVARDVMAPLSRCSPAPSAGQPSFGAPDALSGRGTLTRS